MGAGALFARFGITAEPPPAAWLISILLHAAAIAALLLLNVVRQLPAPPVRSIAVELVSASAFWQATATGQPEPPLVAPHVVATPPAPHTVPTPQTPVVPKPPARANASDGMIRATRLRAGAWLLEPESRDVRATLPKLAPYERMTQLCNIEATEQVRLALPRAEPDTVAASAFGETFLKDGVLIADGAAYRSHRKWFAMRFTCRPRADFEAVLEFSMQLGAEIPQSEWEAHDLIAEDDDED